MFKNMQDEKRPGNENPEAHGVGEII